MRPCITRGVIKRIGLAGLDESEQHAQTYLLVIVSKPCQSSGGGA
jgi:hypothetical protein